MNLKMLRQSGDAGVQQNPFLACHVIVGWLGTRVLKACCLVVLKSSALALTALTSTWWRVATMRVEGVLARYLSLHPWNAYQKPFFLCYCVAEESVPSLRVQQRQ